MAFARQAGDEAKHYRMIAERLARAGLRRAQLRSARQGLRPALQVPRLARDHRRARRGRPVHPRGHRGGEEPPVHRVLRAGGRPRHRHALSRRHRAGRALPSPARPLAPAPLRRPRPRRRRRRAGRPRARSRSRKSCRRRRSGPPASTTPPAADGRRPVARRVRRGGGSPGRPTSIWRAPRSLIAAGEQPDLDVERVSRAPRRAGARPPSRPGAPTTPSAVSTGSASTSSRSRASRATARTTSIRATAISTTSWIAGSASRSRCRSCSSRWAGGSISRWRASGCPGTSSPAPASRASRCCSIPSTAARS